MAFSSDILTYKDATDCSRNTISVSQSGDHIPTVALFLSCGVAISSSMPLPVEIITDLAGSAVVTDDEAIPRNNGLTALVAALHYGACGTNITGGDRFITLVFSGAHAVSEVAAKGTATAVQVTVDATAVNGTQLIAANATGTRRRVVITQTGTSAVYIKPANITAGATNDGEILPGVVGAQSVWFIQGQLRATLGTGTQAVCVREEVLA